MGAALLMLLLLTSCSLTDVASTVLPVGNKPSVEANVALGKTNVQNKSLASVTGEDKRQIADEIVNETTTITEAEVVNNFNIPYWVIILLILGWMLPTPTNMFKWVFRRRSNA